MRVLFSVSPWPTHYMAMVPLGWALQAAGHDVRVMCAPSQVGPVGGAGLTPVPILEGMDVLVQNRFHNLHAALRGDWPYPWLPLDPLTGEELRGLDAFDVAGYHRGARAGFAEAARRSAERAIGFARAFAPHLVVHDPVGLEGTLAARLLGVPAVLFLWGPVGTREPAGLRVFSEDLGGVFARYGAGEPDPDTVPYVVDPCPASLAPPTGACRLPVRYVPYNGPGAQPPWVLRRPDRPRVCVSWSTALSAACGPHSLRLPQMCIRDRPQIVRGLAGLDVEVVLTATRADLSALGELPPDVRVLERFPLHLLLPTVDAVVHHGGAGSTMTAIAAGVPQLALTFAAEQTANGQRVAAAGAGRQLFGHEATPEAIGTAVGELIGKPVYRERATVLRDELRRRPTPAQLAVVLAELVS